MSIEGYPLQPSVEGEDCPFLRVGRVGRNIFYAIRSTGAVAPSQYR